MAAKEPQSPKRNKQAAVDSAYMNSDSGPATPPAPTATYPALKQARAVGELVDSMPANSNKPKEYRADAATPPPGQIAHPTDESAIVSTLSKKNESDKTGGKAALGVNAVKEDLPRVRADSTGQILTTNQGVPIADNQHSLTAGLRGPALRKDFILREKLTHFDHERIPERVVHARGSAAHGYF